MVTYSATLDTSKLRTEKPKMVLSCTVRCGSDHTVTHFRPLLQCWSLEVMKSTTYFHWLEPLLDWLPPISAENMLCIVINKKCWSFIMTDTEPHTWLMPKILKNLFCKRVLGFLTFQNQSGVLATYKAFEKASWICALTPNWAER